MYHIIGMARYLRIEIPGGHCGGDIVQNAAGADSRQRLAVSILLEETRAQQLEANWLVDLY